MTDLHGSWKNEAAAAFDQTILRTTSVYENIFLTRSLNPLLHTLVIHLAKCLFGHKRSEMSVSEAHETSSKLFVPGRKYLYSSSAAP